MPALDPIRRSRGYIVIIDAMRTGVNDFMIIQAFLA